MVLNQTKRKIQPLNIMSICFSDLLVQWFELFHIIVPIKNAMSDVGINQRSENLTKSSRDNKIIKCIHIFIFKLSENIEMYGYEYLREKLLSLNLFPINLSLSYVISFIMVLVIQFSFWLTIFSSIVSALFTKS